VSTQTITRAKLFTSILLLVSLIPAHADWKVDLSRRTQETRTQDLREPASTDAPVVVDPPKTGFFESLFESGQIAGEIVVLNTDKGFVPSTIRVKKGLAYTIHVVNVNEKDKNVSFVLDSFSEHHATFYGKIKTFTIRPQKEGVFKFVSPETSAQGKLVVFPAGGPESRLPASEE
jgi:hypothetical protein